MGPSRGIEDARVVFQGKTVSITLIGNSKIVLGFAVQANTFYSVLSVFF